MNLSYTSSNGLNKKIDTLPTLCPKFRREEVTVGGETFEVFCRDVLGCIAEIYGRHDLTPHLKFKPERHYVDADMTLRIYDDMHTGKWWWEVQVSVDIRKLTALCDLPRNQKAVDRQTPGATIIPVHISSDKTLVTSFCGKSVYPVYITIGNIPKDIRRKPSIHAQVLLAYLPVARLDHIVSESSRRRASQNLFHACMRRVLQPLETAGAKGVQMKSGDGLVRRCHPILAVYAGDHPEQCLVTCIKATECPKGTPSGSLGENVPCRLRDMDHILDSLESFNPLESPREYALWCAGMGIKPVTNPFWMFLPYANIYQSITPDVLHQLHQGVTKHLISWLKSAFGSPELDHRSRCLPPNHNVRHFSKGISGFSRISGKEHAEICKVLLGLIIGLPLPENRSSEKLLRAVRGVLDFLYLAQLPSHTNKTLTDMSAALDAFHTNKSIFIELGIRDDFNFPKLHSLLHYAPSIRFFGTTDNYNTEHSERLHIDLAKDAYAATNRKDELPQMVTWLERVETITRFDDLVRWRLSGRLPPPEKTPPSRRHTRIQIARYPTALMTFDDICRDYGASDFCVALSKFLVNYANPQASQLELQDAVSRFHFGFARVPVFQKVKLRIKDPQGHFEVDDKPDAVHARRQSKAKSGNKRPARFDTVLINTSPDSEPDERGSLQGEPRSLCTRRDTAQSIRRRLSHCPSQGYLPAA